MLAVKGRVWPVRTLKLTDLAIVTLSVGWATVLTSRTTSIAGLEGFLSVRATPWNGALVCLMVLLCHISFVCCGLYRSRRLPNNVAESRDVLRAVSVATACIAALGTILSVRLITLPFLTISWMMSAASLCIFRLGLRALLAHLRANGRNLRFILIIGTNARAVEFAHWISRRPELGYRLIGFVDNNWPGLDRVKPNGYSIVADCAGLGQFLRTHVVDEVAIYLPLGSFYREACEIVRLCEHHGIVMRFRPEMFRLDTSNWQAEECDGCHYMTTIARSADRRSLVIKRMVDIVVSVVLLALLAPVMFGAAIAIALTSPGPIFFLQERVGLNKRRFRIYKFRTMVRDAETLMKAMETRNELSGPVFKIKNDPRITTVGRFLRRRSIDELPQLFNVLKGDMSLVGPRPTSIRDFAGFSEDWQHRRFSVRPGITCLWQVSGRNNVPFDRWMLLDMQYMDEWSLWLDFKILAKTVPAVLSGIGAA